MWHVLHVLNNAQNVISDESFKGFFTVFPFEVRGDDCSCIVDVNVSMQDSSSMISITTNKATFK